MRHFDWENRQQEYQCVFGVWCLCYLTKKESIALLTGIKKALKPDGDLILFESILPSKETADKFNETEEQQMVVRLYERYTRLF